MLLRYDARWKQENPIETRHMQFGTYNNVLRRSTNSVQFDISMFPSVS